MLPRFCNESEPRDLLGDVVGWRYSEPIPAQEFQRLYAQLHTEGFRVFEHDTVIDPDARFCPNCGGTHRIGLYLWRNFKHQPHEPYFELCLDCLDAVQGEPIYEAEARS